MIKDSVTVEMVIDFLNDLYEADQEAMSRFLMFGVPCNESLVVDNDNLKDFIIHGVAKEHTGYVGSKFLYGLMSVINGIFGQEEGLGPISLKFIPACPGGCDFVRTEFRMGDTCPICGQHELVGEGLIDRPFKDIRPHIKAFKSKR